MASHCLCHLVLKYSSGWYFFLSIHFNKCAVRHSKPAIARLQTPNIIAKALCSPPNMISEGLQGYESSTERKLLYFTRSSTYIASFDRPIENL